MDSNPKCVVWDASCDEDDWERRREQERQRYGWREDIKLLKADDPRCGVRGGIVSLSWSHSELDDKNIQIGTADVKFWPMLAGRRSVQGAANFPPLIESICSRDP